MTKDQRISMAAMLWGGFYICPNTGRILSQLKVDDKVLCGCGRSNPKVPQERTEETGTHIVRFLASATAKNFVDQWYADQDRMIAAKRIGRGRRKPGAITEHVKMAVRDVKPDPEFDACKVEPPF